VTALEGRSGITANAGRKNSVRDAPQYIPVPFPVEGFWVRFCSAELISSFYQSNKNL
jgi:hypothetical protein